MTTSPLRLIKVGGSLLRSEPLPPAENTAELGDSSGKREACEEFPTAFHRWLEQQTPAVNVLVAGGGEFVDVIRRADVSLHLGEETAHWLCVDALSVTAQLLGAVLSMPVVTRRQELPEEIPSACVFDPASFLHDLEHRLFLTPLPHTWGVTSDSIAARIGDYLLAGELVLLKSSLPGSAAASYVDDYFSVAAANLRTIRCVNFRSSSFEELPWARRS